MMNVPTPRIRNLALVPALCLAILAMAAALVVSPGHAVAEEAESSKATPTVLAVKFHADWCGTCVRMKPTLTEVQGTFAEKDVLFVTLDLTDEKTTHQAQLMASALGLDQLWADNGGKTGRLFLLDADNKAVKQTVTADQSTEQVTEILEGLL